MTIKVNYFLVWFNYICIQGNNREMIDLDPDSANGVPKEDSGISKAVAWAMPFYLLNFYVSSYLILFL